VGTTPGDTNTYVGYKDDISLSGKYQMLQYFNVSPSVSTYQLWSLDSRDPGSPSGRRNAWEPATGDLGEYFAGYNTRVALDTRIYGIAQAQEDPWFGTVQGARHTIIPTLGFTYAPEIDSNPRFIPNPSLGGTAYQAEQRTVSLGLANEVDLKLASDTSRAGSAGSGAGAPGTGASAARKGESYKLASTNSNVSYNFANKTREWSPVTSSFTVYLTKSVPFTIGTTHMLYDDFSGEGAKNSLNNPMLTAYNFSWRKGLQVAGNFNSGVRVRDARGFASSKFETSPWSADFNYSFTFNSERVGGGSQDPVSDLLGLGGTFKHTRSHIAGGGLKLNPTAGWQMSYNTDYNFSEGEFSQHSFSFHRVLHCWEMDFRWNPVGLSEGWNFVIRITDLPDVKLESSDTKTRRRAP
jgi:hypothetical protein